MRYWLAVGLFLAAVLPPAIAVGWLGFGANPLVVAICTAGLYLAAAWLNLLPPGRPGTSPAQHSPDPPLRRNREPRVSTRRANQTGVAVAGLGVAALLVGALALAARGGSGSSAVAGFPAPAGGNRTSPPAATPSPAANPSSTEPSPQPPETPTAAAPPSDPLNMTGSWLITDTVTQGPSTGHSFQFLVVLVETDGAITGSGDGLVLGGKREKTDVEVQFVRAGSRGVFRWKMQPDGTVAGTFMDSGGNNSGTSTGARQ